MKFGFPVGPIQLLDEVGIDTGLKLFLYWKPLMENVLARLQCCFFNFERRSQRQKKWSGFHLYGQKGRKSKKQVDPAIYPSLAHKGRGDSPHRRLLNGVCVDAE